MNAKDLALLNDQRLMHLAFYKESNGMTDKIKDPLALNIRFSEFKKLVKRGSFTLDQLEESVYSDCGVVGADNKPADPEMVLQNFIDMVKSKMQEHRGNESEQETEA